MDNRTLNFSLATNSTTNDMVWTPISLFNIFILIAGLLTNLTVIFLFAKNSSLRTPFTIYLVNLLTANTMSSLMYYPLELLNDVYTTWWAGSVVCTVYQYALWIAQSAMCNAHVLIALNRLWAVTFPVSYRHHHKKKSALLVCLGMWTYVHLCILPGLVMDALYYRLPEDINGCTINTDAKKIYWIIIQLVLFDLPVVLVLSVFFAICWQTIKRYRTSIQTAPGTNQRGAASHSAAGDFSTTVKSNRTAGSCDDHFSRFLCWKIRKRRSEHGFLMLTLMTLTIFVCYTPADVYFSSLVFDGVGIGSLYLPAAILYELNAVLDPVWFVLALQDFRQEFRRTFFRC